MQLGRRRIVSYAYVLYGDAVLAQLLLRQYKHTGHIKRRYEHIYRHDTRRRSAAQELGRYAAVKESAEYACSVKSYPFPVVKGGGFCVSKGDGVSAEPSPFDIQNKKTVCVYIAIVLFIS